MNKQFFYMLHLFKKICKFKNYEKNLKVLCLSILILSSISNYSCKKTTFTDEFPISKTVPNLDDTQNLKEQGRSSNNSSSSQVPETLKEVFLKDRAILTNILNTGDPELSQTYITKLTNDISDYFLFRENIDIRAEFPNDPNGIILSGLFLATRAYTAPISNDRNGSSKKIISRVDDFGCFISAVSALIGVTEARNIWASIQAGASSETVIGAIKLIGKRVATVLTVVLTVYEVGECLNWW